MRTYKTVSGDMWDTVAKSQMGGERYMSKLMEANPDHVPLVIFPAGIVLNIPDVEIPTPAILPPWKR